MRRIVLSLFALALVSFGTPSGEACGTKGKCNEASTTPRVISRDCKGEPAVLMLLDDVCEGPFSRETGCKGVKDGGYQFITVRQWAEVETNQCYLVYSVNGVVSIVVGLTPPVLPSGAVAINSGCATKKTCVTQAASTTGPVTSGTRKACDNG